MVVGVLSEVPDWEAAVEGVAVNVVVEVLDQAVPVMEGLAVIEDVMV